MEPFSQYIDSLVEACESAIEQMTRLKVHRTEKKQVLKENSTFPFAHIIAYAHTEKKVTGNFVLAFESVNDALRLASAISERLGMGPFDKICENSTDLLNEFLNIVVGRTISGWDELGLSVKFGTPLFHKDYSPDGSNRSQGHIITMDISPASGPEKPESVEQIVMRVNFMEDGTERLKGKSILLAEDSKVMRTIIGKILKAEGAVVTEAENGEEAVRIHKSLNPDLTLMDINMPKLNGFEAIEQIKGFHPKSKFIILSSSSKKDEIINAKTLSVSGYLVKPVEPDKLIERVTGALNKKA